MAVPADEETGIRGIPAPPVGPRMAPLRIEVCLLRAHTLDGLRANSGVFDLTCPTIGAQRAGNSAGSVHSLSQHPPFFGRKNAFIRQKNGPCGVKECIRLTEECIPRQGECILMDHIIDSFARRMHSVGSKIPFCQPTERSMLAHRRVCLSRHGGRCGINVPTL